MLYIILVEDNPKLRAALKSGLESQGEVQIIHDCDSGEEVLNYCIERSPDTTKTVILMDVQLSGELNGIQAAMSIRREFPRFPVVFYSIQDDDEYYRDFRRSGILSHYAYVRKSNFLLPELILPLLKDTLNGRSYIDAEIEERVLEVRQKDHNDPFELLEPNEQIVARMLAQGLTNEQIAERLGFQDKRTISRTNGQIYNAWNLVSSSTDEKVARVRATIIVQASRLIYWDEDGVPRIINEHGDWVNWEP